MRVSLSRSPHALVRVLLLLALLALLPACGGAGSATPSSIPIRLPSSHDSEAVTLVGLVLAPALAPKLTVARSRPFTVKATYSDHSTQDVSSSVVWTSSNPAVATVDAHGLVTGVTTGTTTITATQGSVHDQASLTVVAPSWSAPHDLSLPGLSCSTPWGCLSPQGTTMSAAWILNDGTNNQVQALSATSSTPEVAWNVPSNGPSLPGQDYQICAVAFSADGTRATAVWWNRVGGNSLQTASATLQGNQTVWGPVVNLDSTATWGNMPALALSADGTRATMVWLRSDSTATTIQAASATVKGTTATWTAPVQLSLVGQESGSVQMAASPDGTRATAVWSLTYGNQPAPVVQTASATLQGTSMTWSPVTDLSSPGGTVPALALSADGTLATVVWSQSKGTQGVVQSVSGSGLDTTPTWSPVVELSETQSHRFDPHVALSADGSRSVAVWTSGRVGGYVLKVASATLKGEQATWGSPSELTPLTPDIRSSQVALSADGSQATVVWQQATWTSSAMAAVRGQLQGTTSTWSAPVQISSPGRDALGGHVVVSADGSQALAVWVGSNGVDLLVQGAWYGL